MEERYVLRIDTECPMSEDRNHCYELILSLQVESNVSESAGLVKLKVILLVLEPVVPCSTVAAYKPLS